MPYVDPNVILNPSTGDIIPASLLDQYRENFEFLISPPQCSFGHSTTQNIATSTWTVLSGNTENYDTDGMHSTVTNNSRATVNTAGKYIIIAQSLFAANVTGIRQMRLIVNGSTSYDVANMNPVAGTGTRINGSRSLALSAGDYVEVEVWQNSGGNLATNLDECVATFKSR